MIEMASVPTCHTFTPIGDGKRVSILTYIYMYIVYVSLLTFQERSPLTTLMPLRHAVAAKPGALASVSAHSGC